MPKCANPVCYHKPDSGGGQSRPRPTQLVTPNFLDLYTLTEQAGAVKYSNRAVSYLYQIQFQMDGFSKFYSVEVCPKADPYKAYIATLLEQLS